MIVACFWFDVVFAVVGCLLFVGRWVNDATAYVAFKLEQLSETTCDVPRREQATSHGAVSGPPNGVWTASECSQLKTLLAAVVAKVFCYYM